MSEMVDVSGRTSDLLSERQPIQQRRAKSRINKHVSLNGKVNNSVEKTNLRGDVEQSLAERRCKMASG